MSPPAGTLVPAPSRPSAFDNRYLLLKNPCMGYSLTEAQKRLVRELLKVGRWNNESEIIRYGVHLVAREVEAEHMTSLTPYSPGLLAKAYRRLTTREREEEHAMEQASAYPRKGEIK